MKKITKIISAVCAVLVSVILIVLHVYWSDIIGLLPKKPIATKNSEITLIAHRGFSSVAPANTLASVKEAGEAYFDATEFDIRLTKDGQWVLMHDDSVKHMTDGEGLITQMTLEEIGKLTIDNGYGLDEYPDERVPTLYDALRVCKLNDIRPVIEIKLNEGQAPDYDYLAEIIKAAECNEFTVISFNREAVLEVKKRLPTAEYLLLVGKIGEGDVQYCLDNGLDGIDFNGNKSANYKYIDDITDAGLIAAAWTVDSLSLSERLYKKGVEYITTNTIHFEF